MEEVFNKQTEGKSCKRNCYKRPIAVALTIFFTILFLLILCVAIAYIADFYIYKGSGQDGLLWTVEQRIHGLFSWWNK
ncbi:hypothetical protein [Mycoplasma simbae]|uniref:hypothetical protein n=1 Tax=Mycoplasma simbae TaxID=36744 RepID=UPI0004956193|nr:hypothetical protein [Mycoplasma simbae]